MASSLKGTAVSHGFYHDHSRHCSFLTGGDSGVENQRLLPAALHPSHPTPPPQAFKIITYTWSLPGTQAQQQYSLLRAAQHRRKPVGESEGPTSRRACPGLEQEGKSSSSTRFSCWSSTTIHFLPYKVGVFDQGSFRLLCLPPTWPGPTHITTEDWRHGGSGGENRTEIEGTRLTTVETRQTQYVFSKKT